MYQCKNCEHYFEESHLIDERNIPIEKPCPECGEEKIEMVIGSPIVNLGFRGSTVQSHPENRRFKETVLDPIKRGLGKSGRVNNIE